MKHRNRYQKFVAVLALALSSPLACGDDSDTPAAPDASTGADAAPLTWVAVPGGSFQMGCSPNDDECLDVELPVHDVTVSAFEMTEAEVTQAQFESATGRNPSRHMDCPQCPVETVSWHEAREYCQSVGGRLASETEWEYAARGGQTTRFSCGDDAACLDDVAWYFDNADGQSHPVASKQPNAYGLYDMQGNAWEWLEDCWHESYADGAPQTSEAWVEENCVFRVLRGGAFGLVATGLRVSNRGGDYPDVYLTATPGIRCARDAD